MDNVSGKTALVTGGAGGLGFFIAAALARAGARVVIADKATDKLSDASQSLKGLGPEVVAIAADITKPQDRDKIAGLFESDLGPLDILINNAGVGHWAEFSEQDPDQIELLIDTNFKGPVLLTRRLLGPMIARGEGTIINIGSLSGRKGNPYLSVYSGSKVALMEWSGALRAEVEQYGVHVAMIAPTYVSETGMFARFGVAPPRMIGSVPPGKVADRVLDVIRRNAPATYVSPIPIRPLMALNSLSPRAGSALLRWMGVVNAGRDLAEREAGRPQVS